MREAHSAGPDETCPIICIILFVAKYIQGRIGLFRSIVLNILPTQFSPIIPLFFIQINYPYEINYLHCSFFNLKLFI